MPTGDESVQRDQRESSWKIVELPVVHDRRGNLTFIEGERHVPFAIGRVYYLYDVPGGGGPGSVHVAQRTYTAQRDGIAVWAGGHIHAGGLDISLTRDATGEDYCTATASYQPGGHPNHPNLGQLRRISSCLMHSEVRAGEQFTLRSRYDNEYFVGKAMGIMLVHVYEP